MKTIVLAVAALAVIMAGALAVGVLLGAQAGQECHDRNPGQRTRWNHYTGCQVQTASGDWIPGSALP